MLDFVHTPPDQTVEAGETTAGAADTILILDKSSQGTTLYARGHDIEEIETALLFDKPSGTWLAQGPASEVRRSDERQAISAALKGKEMIPAQLSAELDVPGVNIRQLLSKMTAAGEVIKLGRGVYGLAEESGKAEIAEEAYDDEAEDPEE
ncbi:hypothetical protein [Methylobacterium symbioticum]|uniref:Uncharacterized protein n=1 Tax=Methylobacterium symbioticum TaxID=2584084 RepID=A0A509EJ93_9HYPH|nr:hypothetical protein [Methylobacterium symbioticum]VUD74466.1 hypothetical protein MET9862_05096 [Methylobacterium symbioticum]